MTDFTRYTDDLASRIDPDEEQLIHSAWIDFLEDGVSRSRSGPGVFVPPARTPKPSRISWPEIHINDALADIDAMILSQLGMVSEQIDRGGRRILAVRCNYGVSIMASQLGCEVAIMPREHHNLPTPRPLAGPDPIRRALDSGVPDLRAGQGAAVFDCGERLAELLGRNEVLSRWVHLYHPDAQGPIDNAELAWGPDIFLAFYDTPDLVHQFLDLMTDHYIAFLSAWYEAHPDHGTYTAHWGNLMKGRVMLRDDSLMNLSPQIYEEFVFPGERRCLDELGGGAIHFCGRGSHVVECMSRIPSLTAINASQPHLNEMESIYRATVDRGIRLLSLAREEVDRAEAGGRDLRGLVHCEAA